MAASLHTMACLYCGGVSSPGEDHEDGFCSAAHRQQYLLKRDGTGLVAPLTPRLEPEQDHSTVDAVSTNQTNGVFSAASPVQSTNDTTEIFYQLDSVAVHAEPDDMFSTEALEFPAQYESAECEPEMHDDLFRLGSVVASDFGKAVKTRPWPPEHRAFPPIVEKPQLHGLATGIETDIGHVPTGPAPLEPTIGPDIPPEISSSRLASLQKLGVFGYDLNFPAISIGCASRMPELPPSVPSPAWLPIPGLSLCGLLSYSPWAIDLPVWHKFEAPSPESNSPAPPQPPALPVSSKECLPDAVETQRELNLYPCWGSPAEVAMPVFGPLLSLSIKTVIPSIPERSTECSLPLLTGLQPLAGVLPVPGDPKVSALASDLRVLETTKGSSMLPESKMLSKQPRNVFTSLFPLCLGAPLAGNKEPRNAAEGALWPSIQVQLPLHRFGIRSFQNASGPKAASRSRLLEPMAQFWSKAPSDLKWITLIVPVLLGVVLYSTLTKRTTSAAALPIEMQEPQKKQDAALMQVHTVLSGQWNQVRQNLMARAGVELADDFRNGLSSWKGRGEWARTWSYDPAGSVRTGQLALYEPSMRMSDYTLQFLAQIEKKSLGWVFRAQDLNNYYVMKLVIVKPGPLPTAAIIRYRVVDGKEGPHVQLPLPITVRNDMLYRVSVEVRDQYFTVTVQGQVVDFWSDDTHKTGGVGFFSGRGEQALLRWVEVSHQYDALGRLCAYLAPYNMHSGGSFRQ